jgi:hypothetical protein
VWIVDRFNVAIRQVRNFRQALAYLPGILLMNGPPPRMCFYYRALRTGLPAATKRQLGYAPERTQFGAVAG